MKFGVLLKKIKNIINISVILFKMKLIYKNNKLLSNQPNKKVRHDSLTIFSKYNGRRSI